MPPPTVSARALAGVTFLAGVALVLALPDPGGLFRLAHPQELSVQAALIPLFVETAPAMLLGVLGAGLLRTMVPARPDASSGDGVIAIVALVPLAYAAPRRPLRSKK